MTGTVTEVRPMVGTNNRAVEALVDLPAGSDWPRRRQRHGALVLASREGVVVPAASVVRRPAGDVVYVVTGGKVGRAQGHGRPA